MLELFKKITPRVVKRLVTPFFYGWSGSFDNWDVVRKKCTGYNSSLILNKVRDSALKVKSGSAIYERDSIIFKKPEYSYPLLSSILWAAAQNNGELNILDFGGSLGSTYFQNKLFFDTISELNWCIVEQPEYVKEGLLQFADDRLHFFFTIKECYERYSINVVILSSVLQYMEFPFMLLDEIIRCKPEYLILDRTPFINEPDRITLQKVNPRIYKASYPCWFFNKKKFQEYMAENYEMIFEFDALDKANIKSEFKGFLYTLKTNE